VTTTAGQWTWLVGPHTGDDQADLWGIEAYGTATGYVEVHIVSASSQYQTHVEDIATPIPTLNANQGTFALGDFNGDGKLDLYLIKMNATGSGWTEVHVLNGSNRFQTFLLQEPTAFYSTNPFNTIATVADYNGDGKPDLYLVPMRDTGTTGVEVHIFNGSTRYHTPMLERGVPWPATDTDHMSSVVADYDGDGIPDVYLVPYYQTNSGYVEVDVLGGASQYQSLLLHDQPTSWPAAAAAGRDQFSSW
jgi:hypothetical protein